MILTSKSDLQSHLQAKLHRIEEHQMALKDELLQFKSDSNEFLLPDKINQVKCQSNNDETRNVVTANVSAEKKEVASVKG